MEGLVGKDEQFELNELLNRQPVEVLNEGNDVVLGANGR